MNPFDTWIQNECTIDLKSILFVSIEIRGNLNIEFIIRFLFEQLNKFADLDVSL